MAHGFDLDRFVAAQAPVVEQAVRELRAGEKRSHWMWFVFPQLAGLGSSPMARRYAIVSLDEARAYLRHPVLGPRLLECTGLANAVPGGRTARGLRQPRRPQVPLLDDAVRPRRPGGARVPRGARPVLRRRGGSANGGAARLKPCARRAGRGSGSGYASGATATDR